MTQFLAIDDEEAIRRLFKGRGSMGGGPTGPQALLYLSDTGCYEIRDVQMGPDAPDTEGADGDLAELLADHVPLAADERLVYVL